MSKVLVTYATKTGSVTEIAERIGETLREAGVDVDVKPVADKPDASAYDAIVVGSGIRAGNWHQPAKDWVKANAPILKSKPTAFFSVGLSAADGKQDEMRAYTEPLSAETGVVPVDVGTLAGWFVPERFGFAERAILKMMKAPQGDGRDMAAVEAWARSVAPKLTA